LSLDFDVNQAFLNDVDTGGAGLKQHTETRPKLGRKNPFPG
jgi:hypothetical protein